MRSGCAIACCQAYGSAMHERYQPDWQAYHHRAQTGPCFICNIVAGRHKHTEHIVYEDKMAIAFLDKYPTLFGYVLIAPREHKVQVSGDFTLGEYLDLQRVVYWVAEAVRQELGAERVYLLSLGSNQGNAHVHWHVAPLPPGVPYLEQQLAALREGVLLIPEEEQAALAARLRCRLEAMGVA
jgi:diadenosine tetraphosphate (Ap4A) HIT family hydrolase